MKLLFHEKYKANKRFALRSLNRRKDVGSVSRDEVLSKGNCLRYSVSLLERKE